MVGNTTQPPDGVSPTNPTIRINPPYIPTKSASKRHNQLPNLSQLTLLIHNLATIVPPLNTIQYQQHAKKKQPSKPGRPSKPGKQQEPPPLRYAPSVLLQEGEILLTNSDHSHEEWISQVQFALNHRSRVKAACALPEDECPQPLRKANKAARSSLGHSPAWTTTSQHSKSN